MRVLSRKLRAGAAISIEGAPDGSVVGDASRASVRRDVPDEDAAPTVGSVPLLALEPHLIVVDKPAGMLTEPTRKGPVGSCAYALEQQLRAREEDVGFLAAAHRLDFDTSGVVVFARSSKAAAVLGRQFAESTVERTYVALATGTVPASLTLDAPVRRLPGTHARVVVVPSGAASRTDVELLAQGEGAALVVCRPRTGRLHQIRVHLAHAGHALVGDRRYGAPSEGEERGHLGLHAYALAFAHPSTGARVEYVAPLPASFLAACAANKLEPSVVAAAIAKLESGVR